MEKCKVYLLQFVENTQIIVEGGWKIIWVIKAILRGFELVSGLGVNFIKVES